MPKPFPVGAQMQTQTGCVLNRPNCAMLLGAITAEWAFAEALLGTHYASFVCGPIIPEWPLPGYWAAFETFDMITSFSQRRAMLKAAAKRLHIDDAVVDKFAKLLKALQDSSGGRMVAAHGRWGISDQFPDALIYTRTLGGVEDAIVYEVPDFEKMLGEIATASANLNAFFQGSILPVLKSNMESVIASFKAAQNTDKATAQSI